MHFFTTLLDAQQLVALPGISEELGILFGKKNGEFVL